MQFFEENFFPSLSFIVLQKHTKVLIDNNPTLEAIMFQTSSHLLVLLSLYSSSILKNMWDNIINS